MGAHAAGCETDRGQGRSRWHLVRAVERSILPAREAADAALHHAGADRGARRLPVRRPCRDHHRRPTVNRRRVDGAVTTERTVTPTVAEIVAAHRSGRGTPDQTLAQSFARIRAHGDPAVFITLRDEA